MEVVELDGKKYVKASRAAREVGYTADYVGQLCRAGKVDSRLVGRTWYVEEDSLYDHKHGRTRSNKKKTLESFTEDLKKYSDDRASRANEISDHATYAPTYKPSYRERLLNVHINYSPDDAAPIPKVARGASASAETRGSAPEASPASSRVQQRAPETVSSPVTTETPQEVAEEGSARTEKETNSVPVRVQQKERPREAAPRPKQKPRWYLDAEGTYADEDEVDQPLGTKRLSAIPPAQAPQRSLMVRAAQGALPATVALTAVALFAAAVFMQSVWVYSEEGGETAFDSFLEVAAVSAVLEELENLKLK